MNKKHQALVDRANRINSFYDEHQLSIDTLIPAFGLEIPRLEGLITEVGGNRTAAAQKTQPITVAKLEIRRALEGLARQVAIGIRFYAKNILKDTELENEVKYTDSSYLNLADDELLERVDHIHAIGLILIPAPPAANPLAPFGVTVGTVASPGLFDNFSDKIEAFEAICKRARNLEIKIKGINQQVVSGLRKIDQIIATFNSYAKFFPVNSVLYNDYYNNRRVDRINSRTKVEGKVTSTIIDTETGLPKGIKNVVIVGVGKPYQRVYKNNTVRNFAGKTYKAITDSNGNYTLYIGDYRTVYNIVFKEEGYGDVTLTDVEVTKGQTTNKNVTMATV